jgi:hypothetical protein
MAVERVRSCWGNYIWEKRRERERGKGRRLKDLISSIDCIASLFSTLAIHTHISPPYPYNSFSIFPCTRKWERECVSFCGPPIAAAAGHLLCNLDDHDYISFLFAPLYFIFQLNLICLYRIIYVVEKWWNEKAWAQPNDTARMRLIKRRARIYVYVLYCCCCCWLWNG